MRTRSLIAALLVVAGLVLAGCGDDTGSASSVSEPSRSTTSTTAEPTVSTVSTDGGTLLTVDDTVLVAPADDAPVAVEPDDPCDALESNGECGSAGSIVWVTAAGDDASPVTIYAIDGDEATPTLVVEPGSRVEYGAATVLAADLDGAADDELVVGLRNSGTGGLLQLEVVGHEGVVVAHVTLDRGRATLDGGRLRTWAARYLADDPNCCPSQFEEGLVVVDGDRWFSVPRGETPADDVPAGDFP